ncbi:MAG: hypothetical protein KAH91_02855, partial [Thermoplasmatales archaeon]|nr:hypothetical protein [Thermoplasmatales archaeon]
KISLEEKELKPYWNQKRYKMNKLEEDPVLGRFFDTPEKKAKWLVRIKIAYILWIVFMVIGILTLLLWYLIK